MSIRADDESLQASDDSLPAFDDWLGPGNMWLHDIPILLYAGPMYLGAGPMYLGAGPMSLCTGVYLSATLSSRCGASPPRVGQYSHLPSLVTHVDAPFGTLSRNLVTSPVGDTFIIVIPLDM